MKKKKGITLPEIKQVAAQAISYFNINKYIHAFTDAELISLCENADPDMFTDISVADNQVVQENFRWEKVRPKRLSRMMARAIDLGYIDLLNQINMKAMKIRIGDLKPLLRRRPEMIERFNLDLQKINNVEAHMLLELGQPYFLDHIDVSGRSFSTMQQFDICKSYDFIRRVLLLFNCRRFDGFQTKEVLRHTGHDNIDLLDVSNMKLIDWIDLLTDSPDMYRYCDPTIFRNGLISELISLAVLSDDDVVYTMIREKDLADVSPFGWEKLMSNRPEMFEAVCDYGKMDALNKKRVIESHPHLQEMIRAKTHSM